MSIFLKNLTAALFLSTVFPANAQQIIRLPAHGVLTQIFVGDLSSPACSRTHREGLAELLVSVGGAFADAIGDALEKYLTDFANKYSSDKQVLLTSGDFYRFKIQKGVPQVSMDLACITIVRGKVGHLDAETSKTLTANKKALDPGKNLTGPGDDVDLEFFKNLRLVDYPEMYLELQVQRHDTADLFKVTPTYLYFRRGGADLGNGAVDIIVTLTFTRAASAASTSDSAKGFNTASTVLRIRSVNPNTENLASDIFYETAWAPLPPLPAASDLDAIKNQTGNSTVLEPFNLVATYQEAGTPPAAIKFFSDIAKGSGSSVSDEVKDLLKSLMKSASGKAAN